MAAYETRSVLAGAYATNRARRMGRGGTTLPQTLLTHTVTLDERGAAASVLCNRVQLDSMCDPGAHDTSLPPTCPVCLRRDPRFAI